MSGAPGHLLLLLLGINTDTTIGALCRADSTRLQGHEHVIVGGIDRDAVRVGIGGHVHQPRPRLGIDDSHHRSVRHIPRREVVSVVSWVIPGFVDPSDICNGGEELARSPINYVHVRREGFPIVVATADKEVVARPLNDAGGHAVRHVERVLDKRPVWAPQVGINNVHGTEGQISGVRVRICNQKATGVGIECGPADTSDGNRPEASGRRGGLTGAKRSIGVEHWSVMARSVGTEDVRPGPSGP